MILRTFEAELFLSFDIEATVWSIKMDDINDI